MVAVSATLRYPRGWKTFTFTSTVNWSSERASTSAFVSAMPQIGNNLLDVMHCNRINTSKRLVEQHELRIADERPRNFQSASLTT